MTIEDIEATQESLEEGLVFWWPSEDLPPRQIISIENTSDSDLIYCGKFKDGTLIMLDDVPHNEIIIGNTVEKLNKMTGLAVTEDEL